MEKIITSNSTTKIISAIIYLPVNEIVERMERYSVQNPNLQYAVIQHKGENGEKDHCHAIFRSTSNKIANINNLRNQFLVTLEEDEGTYKKGDNVTRMTLPSAVDSVNDWKEYSLHSKAYCEAKNLTKEVYDYPIDNIKGTPQMLDFVINSKPTLNVLDNEIQTVRNGIENGLSDIQILFTLPAYPLKDLTYVLKGIEVVRSCYHPDPRDEYIAKRHEYTIYQRLYNTLVQNGVVFCDKTEKRLYETDLEILLSNLVKYAVTYFNDPSIVVEKLFD